jgi:arylsulfatase A-like enzyme
MEDRTMKRSLWVVPFLLFAGWLAGVVIASGCDDDDESSGEGSPGVPEAFADYRTHVDLIERVHLADVDHHGTFIDFGTPSRMKYTVGQWRTGWVSDESSGDTTFSYVGDTGRVFFQVDRAGPITLRIRAKAVGSRNLSPFLNNHQLELVRLEEGDAFRDYDLTIPAEHVEVGENYLLMRFGGTTQVNGQAVAAAIESMRIVSGTSIPEGEYAAPRHGALVLEMAMGGATRRAIAVRKPTRLSYYLQIPAGAKLGFGVGAEGSTPAAVKVAITPEGGERVELYSGRANASGWSDEVVDLGRFAGSVARIDFLAEGEGEGRVGWSSAALLLPKVEETEREPAKNVVVLLIDTLRADKLRPFNPRSRVETPNLDRLAEESAVFLNAHSPENWTKPSVASVLTGLFPTTHGTKESESRLPSAALLLSEHMKANGFRTGSFIANGYVSDRFGFDQGWDHYTNFIREGKNTDASNVFSEAGDFIEANKDHRFFTYIQTIDPHVPYDPPAEYLRMYDDRADYAGQVTARQTPDLLEKAKRDEVTFDGSDRRRLLALHDGEITQHDAEMGRFIERLKALGVWDDTIFIITSDHGEEFDDHGSWGHGHSVYEELVHVPLLVHRPGLVPAAQIRETVATLDIPATVAEATGVPPLPASEGRSLLGFARGETPGGPSVAFSDFLNDRRVITAGRYKLELRGINATLYDLEEDPGETREVDRATRPIAMRFLRIMLGQFLGASNRQRWLDADQGRGLLLEGENAQMDDTIRSQLQALGYAN